MHNPASVDIGESVIFQRLEQEAVLLEMSGQVYYGLDDVGVKMWELLLKYHDIETVVTELKGIYGVDETVLKTDLTAFVRRLLDAKLLKECA